MVTEYYSSINKWLEARRPLDKPFLIVREHIMSTKDVNEDSTLNVLETLCTLIIHSVAHYRDDLGGSSYHIEPASSMFHSRTFIHKGEAFGVCAESAIVSDRPRVRISVGAIVTILS